MFDREAEIDELRARCETAMFDKYQVDGKVPDRIKERLDWELEIFHEWDLSVMYMSMADAIKLGKIKRSQYHLSEFASASLVAYLLDMTEYDPMDPECRLYLELYLLKSKDFDIDVDSEAYEVIVDTLKYVEPKLFERLWMDVDPAVNLIGSMERRTGITPTMEQLDDPRLVQDIMTAVRCAKLGEEAEVWRKVLEIDPPQTFNDLVDRCRYRIVDGYLDSEEPSEIQARPFFEECYEDFLERGLSPEDAARICGEIMDLGFLMNATEADEEMLRQAGYSQEQLDEFSWGCFETGRYNSRIRARMMLTYLFYKHNFPEMFP